MKKHSIPGNVRCLRCGGPTRNVTHTLCLPCILEINELKVVDFALDARFFANRRFSGPRLLAFAKQHSGLIRSILNFKSIIIKAREQAQQDTQIIEASRDICDVDPTTSQPKTSKKSGQPQIHEQNQQLLARLLAEQDGLCAYCASPLTSENAHPDTILPTSFNHSKMSLRTKAVYYKVNALAGNLVAACVMCNWRKGQAEQRGVQILRFIGSCNYTAQPNNGPVFLSTRGPRIYFNPEDLPAARHGRYAQAELEILSRAMGCFGLRVSYPCPHRTERIFGRWIEDARTLIFGCGQCVPPAQAILEVDVRRKNWVRTDRNLQRRAEPGVLILDRTLLRRCPAECAFEFMGKILRRRKGELREVRISARELQRRPKYETVFKSAKWMHERFGFPPPPPLEVLKKQYEACATEADAYFFVQFAPDGAAARQNQPSN